MKGYKLVQNTSFEFLGKIIWFVENQTLAQNTRNEKKISNKCNPSRGQAKVHGFKVV